MNTKLAVLILVSVSGLLSGCPRTDEVRQNDAGLEATQAPEPVDKAATGDPNFKTWVVHTTGAPAGAHMIAGDAFRLQKTGGGYQLRPLKNLLEERWGYPEGSNYVVNLEKISPELLCGEVTFMAHEPAIHKMKIKVLEDDFLIVEFLKPENSCTSTKTHGGVAHAQN